MDHPPAGRPRDGFTLIELLTVIAIIAILAAILIPVVGKVRDQARGAQCGSNLRAVGMAMHLYADDNNDAFPPFNDRNNRPAQGLWWLHGLMGMNEANQQLWPNYLGDVWDDQQKRANFLICPQSSHVYPELHGIGYGINMFHGQDRWNPKRSAINDPTRYVLVADANLLLDLNWYGSALTFQHWPNTLHAGGAYYLFAAGNVSYIRAQAPHLLHSPPLGAHTEVIFRDPHMTVSAH